jgi:response regulator of citrate/malate metabolism
MKQEKDKLGSIANDFLLKPIFKYELLELLVKYLTYESLIENEKSDIQNRKAN